VFIAAINDFARALVRRLLDRYEQQARKLDRPVHLAAALRGRGVLNAAVGDDDAADAAL
jgi:hypothetical protein